MDCAAVHEALSAMLDGEPATVERGALEAHLADCAECRRWREDAHEVTRRFRLAGARNVPSADESLLVAARGAAPRGGKLSPTALTRLALVSIGIQQLIVTVWTSVLGSDHDSPTHVAHEMASFDLALTVGFIAAALRPSRARGISVVVGAAALLLVTTALIDVAAGRTSAAGELPHLLAVAGWLLLRRLVALTRPLGEDPASRIGPSLARSLRSSGARVALPTSGPTDEQTLDHDPVPSRTQLGTHTHTFPPAAEPMTSAEGCDPTRRRALAG
jgi:predicted anti-sigma-YlaC factor YlaD